MIDGNLENRVRNPLSDVTGILVGQNLLEELKNSLISENVFKKMFGSQGEHIFINSWPNMNETITPVVLLSWKNERIQSLNAYYEGSIDMIIALPTQIKGDYNALRAVGALFQRWMMTKMVLFRKVLGLIELGVGAEFDYTGLAVFSGVSFPTIKVNIPFKFDLQKVAHSMSDQYGFDPDAALDDIFGDDTLLEYNLTFCNPDDETTITTTGDNIEQV